MKLSIRKIALIALVFTISSCDQDRQRTIIQSGGDGNGKSSQALREISLNASRDYRPSSWNNYEDNAEQTGEFLIPEIISTIEGNTGTGWLSLAIGERKFCYQGDARNNNSGDGDSFIIKKEKTDLNEDCFKNSNDQNYALEVLINEGDSVTLSVNGGGCGSLCEYTEVVAKLSPVASSVD